MNKIIIGLLILCLAGIGYVIYYQQAVFPNKLKKCNDIAVEFERMRHAPVDDLEVTNQDITGYMKNMVNCLAD
jgi:hypothetical protein